MFAHWHCRCLCLDSKEHANDKSKLFGLIVHRCTPSLQNKLETMDDYETLEDNDDVASLLQRIRDLVHETSGHGQHEFWMMRSAMTKLPCIQQCNHENVHAYPKCFMEQLQVTEAMWGSMIPAKMKGKPTDNQNKARDKFLACSFLAGAEKHHKSATTDLNNDYIGGNLAAYPTDVVSALQHLVNRRDDTSRSGGTPSFQSHANASCAQQPPRPNTDATNNTNATDDDRNPAPPRQTSCTGRTVGWHSFQDGIPMPPGWSI